MSEIPELEQILAKAQGKEIDTIHENRNGNYGGADTTEVLKLLPASTIDRVKELYQIDYMNGWHCYA